MSALVIRLGAAQTLPLDVLLSTIPSLPRHVLDRLVEQAIDRLDELDGDPDLEAAGDEDDHTDAEDEIHGWRIGKAFDHGAGCPVSDPGGFYPQQEDAQH